MGSKVAADTHHAVGCGCWLRCCSSSSDNNCRVAVVCRLQCCTLQLGVLDWSWPGRPAPSTLPTFYILFCTLTHPVLGSTPHHTSHHTHRITSSGWCLSQCLSSSHHIPSLLITHFPTILFTLTS